MWGGQGLCEQRIEVFFCENSKKKILIFFFFGGGGGGGGLGRVWGVRVDVIEE